MKCVNCGEEFETDEKTDVCLTCYENIMKQIYKEESSREWANYEWQIYWEEQERKTKRLESSHDG